MAAHTYEGAGVGAQSDALSSLREHLGPTLNFPEGVEPLTDFGHYASVLRVAPDLAIAISTDGVGSKTIIASRLDRYDTIGYDCVAMNVNDVICVGARPFAMVDYLGVNTLDPRRAEEILRGLGAAAKEASIAIPGGELAQLPEVIGSDGKVAGDETAFDLVGTCVGMVHPEKLILGDSIGPGDTLIGIRSSGIHSNGLTLARRVLLDRFDLDERIGDLGRTLGEELLEPTEIYVRAAHALWNAGIETHGLAHITSDGLTNLCRLSESVGYQITQLPDPPAIFRLIQETGGIAPEEMYRVFNMGVGFVVIVAEGDAEAALEEIRTTGYPAQLLGTVTEDAGRVLLEPVSLIGTLEEGASSFRRV